MRSAEGATPLRHAVALGLLQGPAELLPISSSAHVSLLPWLAGWPYVELDGRRRKSFEVALHAGAGGALAIAMSGELLAEARVLDRRRAAAIALSWAPPAIVGYAFGERIETRLGGPRSIAMGLLAGAVAMLLADGRGDAGAGRPREDAGPLDGLALGVAQACALVPGVSRSGATMAAARARGFSREAARSLSWHAGLPVLLGVSALGGSRLLRAGAGREERDALAAGAGAAFVSTLAAAAALRPRAMSARGLWPYALYRCALAALILRRARRAG